MLGSGMFFEICGVAFKICRIYGVPTVVKDINPINLYLKRLSLGGGGVS